MLFPASTKFKQLKRYGEETNLVIGIKTVLFYRPRFLGCDTPQRRGDEVRSRVDAIASSSSHEFVSSK